MTTLADVTAWAVSMDEQARAATAKLPAAEKRAEVAEKRAQDAERRLQQVRLEVPDAGKLDLLEDVRALKARCSDAEQTLAGNSLAARIRAIRDVVGGEEDLLEAVRRLKNQCLATQTLLAYCQNERDTARAAVDRLTLDLAEARRPATAAERLAHEETVRANGWKERATVAESALAERNREIDLLKRQAQSAGEARDSLIEQIDAQRDLAKTLRAEVESLSIRHGAACSELVALRAEIASLRGKPFVDWARGPDQSVELVTDGAGRSVGTRPVAAEPEPTQLALDRIGQDWRRGLRHRAIESLLALLPSPSHKAGRWKCRRCGSEARLLDEDTSGYSGPDGLWAKWGEWRHWCPGAAASPVDRIGDAPEVTP